MPSSIASGASRNRSVKGGSTVGKIVPDFIVSKDIAAANFGGANSGVYVWSVPQGTRAAFLGGTLVYSVAGNNPLRIQVIRAASTAAAGAAAATNIEDLTAAIATSGTANTVVNFNVNKTDPISGKASFIALEAGDKVAVAASLANTGLAGGVLNLRFVWI